MVSTRLLVCLALFACCAATEEVEMVERQVEHVDMLPRLHLVRDFASDAEMDYIIQVCKVCADTNMRRLALSF